MGNARYVGNAIRLNLDETRLLCDVYKKTEQTLKDLTKEQKRVVLDLVLKATNFLFIGGTWESLDGTKITKIELPTVRIEDDKTSQLIKRLATEIGVIGGTISLWDRKYDRQYYRAQALATGNLSEVTNLNLGACSNDDLKELVGKNPELKRFRMRLRYCLDKDLYIKFISKCPKLEVLCLNTFSDNNDFLSRILENAPNLKVLKISRLCLSEKDFQALKAKVSNGSIHTLDFSKNDMPREECWAELIDAGAGTLQGLVLDDVRLHHCDPRLEKNDLLDKILSSISKCKNLRRLEINAGGLQSRMTDDFFKQLLQNNPNLEEIRSYWLSKITDITLESIAVLGKNLKIIYLHQTAMTRKIVEAFDSDFWKRPNALAINISGDKVDDWQDPNSPVKGGNHFCYVRKGKSLQFNLSDTHRRYWDPAYDPAYNEKYWA